MADIATLKQNVQSGAEAFAAELALAGPHWETKPANSADGEAAWCARQVAEHIIGAAGMFAAGLARATGAAAPARTGGSYATAAEAAAAFPAAHGEFAKVLDQVSDAQLDTELEFGPLGKQTVASVIGIVSYHLNDHANQLKALRG